MEPEDGAGDNAESTEGAGQQFGEVVAGDVFHDFTPAAGERAVRKSHGGADDEIAQGPEAETENAAIVGGEDASDRSAFGPQRINGEALPMLRESGLQSGNGATSLDADSEIGPGVFNDLIEARRGKDEVSALGRIAPTELGAPAAWNDGEASVIGETKGCGQLLLVGRFDDQAWLDARDRIGCGSRPNAFSG